MTAPKGINASVRTTDAPVGPDRHINVDLTLHPANAADHANWLTITSWQGRRTGDGGLVLTSLRKVGPGHYVSAEPVPADGEWKTIVRLQKGRELVSMPIYMPQDNAIPAPLIAAQSHFDRPFVRDKSLLQRDQPLVQHGATHSRKRRAATGSNARRRPSELDGLS